MMIIDAHLDLAWNALQWNRDLQTSVHTIRTTEANTPGKACAQNTVALPELQQGHVALCFSSLLARSTGRTTPHVDYSSALQAHAIARGQLAYYHALAQQGHTRVITSRQDLDEHIERWSTWEAMPSDETPPPLGLIISMESADPILAPDQLASCWDGGVRIIGPAHQGNGRYAGGTGVEAGLTAEGLALLSGMRTLGVILDVTHLSDRAFWQALEHFEGPIIASHSNSRALVPHQRQLSDPQLKALIARGGVIGVALDTWMLQPGWIKGASSNENVTLEQVADHIEHICELAGSSAHAGIGSDLDGGFGREQTPRDLDTVADLQGLIPILTERGYSEDNLAAVMHGNWLRFLREIWKEAL